MRPPTPSGLRPGPASLLRLRLIRLRWSVRRWRAALVRLVAAGLERALPDPLRRTLGTAAMRGRLVLAALAFAEQPTPLVSVLIAMYGRPGITLNALRALMRAAAEVPLEVLLCDDCSPDDAGRFFLAVPGLNLIRNPHNLGYLRSNNLLAAQARGDYLLLLNSDTVIQPGALRALLAVFHTHADAGLVGARLMYPDGRLQEAGAIVLPDGGTRQRGCGEQDRQGLYDRIEEVDYCSAAAVLIRRQLFLELGGFDARYLPAYYEDVDLAFRVRAAGLKVYYQPAARVTHLEHASSTLSRASHWSSLNQPKFLRRWQTVIEAGDHPSARRRGPEGAGSPEDQA